ncbi:GNAT family N-acetyltransferase [Jeotgalibaca sp. A122]|uniref:GNAT family N-acetyltransferase n=1 Tax=Jeotgalibaca sp. A122 TaxID=3457322 RepID=UPI003FD04AB2
MINDLIIRKVTPEDLDIVTKVEKECFPEAEAATKESFAERIATFSDSFFLAEIEGEVIGFINGNVTDETVIADEMFEDVTYHNPEGAYQAIFGLDVIPKHQKQGIAARLMNHLIETAREQGRKGVILTCKERLIPYYSRFGFKNMGRSASTHGGSVWYDMLLEYKD